MARYTRLQTAMAMEQAGMIPVFYHPDPEICFEVIKACFKGGLRVFEFTNRGDYAHEVFSIVNKRLAQELPEVIIGTGSVMDAGTASLYIQVGTNFIVSPVIKEDIAMACNRRKILWSPGCGSVTEISRAEELGAEIVKIFPGTQVGGPKFVQAVKGPMPWTSIMPTGGVEPTEENLSAWFKAGVTCVGMGSQLISKEIVNTRNFTLLEENVRTACEILKNIRQTL
ncbi:bifunctional 4-hydroxy-2-oxoglutarate aldolase/2-dehydro-3-deoxy-phosphogluconate aldolase [Perlabentimonas gracilis]|uniref:bifunctional 4-hydroxy-2-oxoglutarate aldolase/2-dehydro-3-deoxy-phosphogluconate aldolase n=1 Tax=Perlabentimonas gracilis TaxID=2715279 RepID=UPI00140E09D1|nr:bifunctional 4-hydroxy-2-oxoglutarate aldolase/2-dehydro-3-deoxy-phosphogluconate aldolase [Perlabentimonas gracilis]NHB68617.1 bifunctional 4-hydroxy-2-oxoglutarate aldolase/2-dehydro-3-deoxy-phosphogluconate aldolase [Perlabentimonas gracilis]